MEKIKSRKGGKVIGGKAIMKWLNETSIVLEFNLMSVILITMMLSAIFA